MQIDFSIVSENLARTYGDAECIVNIERVQEMQPWLNGEYAVVLRTGTRLTLSRGYREKLQERLGRGI